MAKNKIIFIILTFLGAVLLFVSLAYFVQRRIEFNKFYGSKLEYIGLEDLSKSKLKKCTSDDDLDYIGECFMDLAVQEKDYKICYLIYDPIENRIDPYFNEGFKSDSDYRRICFAEVFEAVNDKAICGVLTDEEARNYCYQVVGIRQKDVRLCQKIKNNQGVLNDCYYEIALCLSDDKLCDKVTAMLGDKCYLNLAMFKNEPKLCDKAGYYKNECLQEYAVKSRIISCDGYIGAKLEDCLTGIQETRPGLAWCNSHYNQDDEILKRYRCYMRKAEEIYDPTICNVIKDKKIQAECYDLFKCE